MRKETDQLRMEKRNITNEGRGSLRGSVSQVHHKNKVRTEMPWFKTSRDWGQSNFQSLELRFPF